MWSVLDTKPGAGLNPRLLALIPTVTAGVADGMRVGSFWVRLNVNFALANTNTSVQHGLGRKPCGYFCTGRSVAGVLLDDRTQAGWDHQTIVLQASLAGHYDMWIF